MLGVARQVDGTLASELCVAVDEEAALLDASGIVGERVGRAVVDDDGNALAVLDVDGGTAVAGQADAVEHDGGLQFAVHRERAV